MKTEKYLLVGAIWALLCSSCGNTSQKETKNIQETMAFVTTDTTVKDSLQLIWIRDNARERIMPLSLFGELPLPLIDSLDIQNGVLASISTFLLETNGQYILFDTGVGAPDSRLIPGLAAAGLSPTDIDYIYLTHFHGDHIGGMMKEDSVVFPNAEVYAAQAEYDGWMQMPDEKKAQVTRTMTAYQDRLHLFEYGDTLPTNIVAMEAIGHTPGHTVYQVGGFLIVGDLVHGAALQLPHPEYCAAYDMDPEAAIQTRKHYLKYAKDNNLLMAGMHQPVEQ